MAPRKRKPDSDMTLEDEILMPDMIIDDTLVIDTSDEDNFSAPAKKYSNEERKKYALAMRLSGATYAIIAQQLGTDKAYAWKLVRDGLEEMGTEDLKVLRTTYQARLEQLLVTRWGRALGDPTKGIPGDDAALGAVLMILDRIERLYGLAGHEVIEQDDGKATLIILGGDTSQHRAAIEEQKRKGNSR